jgi:arylsulfatase A-like enzyme
VVAPATFGEDPRRKPALLGCDRRDDEDEWRKLTRYYYGILAGVEDSVGRLLGSLEANGLLEDTLVILTSDNGLSLGEHGLMGKRVPSEGSIRVPLLIRYPKWFSGGVVVEDQLALNLDIAPTILDAAGVPTPDSMQGVSLRALASGEKERGAFLYQYFRDPRPGWECFPSIRAVRTREYKYVTYPGSEEFEELYDLGPDPLESRNLIGDQRYDAVRDRLRLELQRLRVGAGDLSQ